METSKKDWKLYQEKIGKWQESYMERLITAYIEELQSNEKASTKFWNLDKRIKADRKHPGVIIELRKSNLVYDLVRLIHEKVITVDDLHDFSDELKDQVNVLLETLL